MPKSGSFTRTVLAVAAAAILAVVASGTAGASPAKHTGTTLSGAGSSFVSPLVTIAFPWLAVTSRGRRLTYQPFFALALGLT